MSPQAFVTEHGLRRMWQWAWHELGGQSSDAMLVAILVATTLRDRGFALDAEQRKLLRDTESSAGAKGCDA